MKGYLIPIEGAFTTMIVREKILFDLIEKYSRPATSFRIAKEFYRLTGARPAGSESEEVRLFEPYDPKGDSPRKEKQRAYARTRAVLGETEWRRRRKLGRIGGPDVLK